MMSDSNNSKALPPSVDRALGHKLSIEDANYKSGTSQSDAGNGDVSSTRSVLLAVARAVGLSCTTNNLPLPTATIPNEYSINFEWRINGKKKSLRIDYSPKRQRLTPYFFNDDDWVRTQIGPLLEPLLYSTLHPDTVAAVSSPSPQPESDPMLRLAAYFSNAVETLQILKPVANSNVNFGVITERTKVAIAAILDDPTLAKFKSSALIAQLEKRVPRADFNSAKEYLIECLTLCQLTLDQLITTN